MHEKRMYEYLSVFVIQSNLGVVTLFSMKNRTSEKNLKYGFFSHATLYKISS